MSEPLHEEFLRAIRDMQPDSELNAYAAKAMATELLDLRPNLQAATAQRDDLQDELGLIRSILFGDTPVDNRTTEQVARDLVRDKAELLAHARQLRAAVDEPATDPTPLCPVCGCGVVDDVETTAAGADVHGECLTEAAMLAAIAECRDRVAALRRQLRPPRPLFDANRVAGEIIAHLDKLAGPDVVIEARRHARETAAERDALRDTVTALKAELVGVRSELDAVTAAILDAARMPMLAVLLGSEENARRLVDRIETIGGEGREPDGWIVGRIMPDSRAIDLGWGNETHHDPTRAE